MINRFVGKLAELAAILRYHSTEQNPVIVEDKPELNEFEKLWNRTRELAKFNPVYLTKGNAIYQVIDELTYIKITIRTGKNTIKHKSTPTRHHLFSLIANQVLAANGYTEISAREFHHDFTVVQNQINLKVNQSIQAAI